MSVSIDVRIVGTSLDTQGYLGVAFALTPIGLLTQGFINDCHDIWYDTDVPITTVWVNAIMPDNIETCVGD